MLKRILEILPAVCLATSMASSAQSPFIGQWKFDSSRSRTPDEMKVQSKGGNQYTFDFGQTVERDRGFGRGLSSVAQSRKPKKLND